MLSESNHGGLAAYGMRGEGWVVEYHYWGADPKGHSLYGDEKGMKVSPSPSKMIHSLPWPLIPGFTPLLFSLLAVCRRAPLQKEFKLLIAKTHWQIMHSHALCRYKCIHACRHTGFWFMDAHLKSMFASALMSKVHCSTLLTSNVTNNFFLQLHCSNPFSGIWNGNIITFLWCSAFDKTATCWAECLTELDASRKPSSDFTSLPYSLSSIALSAFPPLAPFVTSR